MIWDVNGVDYSPGFFGSFEPDEILYDFDGPRIFTIINNVSDRFLAYQCAEENGLIRYIVVPVNAELVRDLRAGHITMREALYQPWTWLVDRLYSGELISARKIDIRDLPDDTLPRPGVLLLPSLRPVFSIRMVGEGLGVGRVPASVIRRAVDSATAALKVLVEWVVNEKLPSGRPEAKLRHYYDLPAQRVAFASFEIAFAAPSLGTETHLAGEEKEVFDKVGELLQKGLDWASSPREESISNDLDDLEAQAILKALAKLTPPRSGIVTEVHLGGRLSGTVARQKVLTRKSSARIQKAIISAGLSDVAGRPSEDDTRQIRFEGFVREFDRDAKIFTLRDARGQNLGVFSFVDNDDVYVEALRAFIEERSVRVLGYESAIRDNIVDIVEIA